MRLIVHGHWGSYTLIMVKEAPDALQKLQHSQKETIRWITAFEEKNVKNLPMVAFECMCVLWPFISYHVSFCCFIAKWEFNIEMRDCPCLFTVWALWFPCLFFWSSPSVCVCACVCMCREGALDGLDFFLKKTNKKPQTNGTHFVYASSKLQSRSLRFKILLLSHLGRRLSVGFLHL